MLAPHVNRKTTTPTGGYGHPVLSPRQAPVANGFYQVCQSLARERWEGREGGGPQHKREEGREEKDAHVKGDFSSARWRVFQIQHQMGTSRATPITSSSPSNHLGVQQFMAALPPCPMQDQPRLTSLPVLTPALFAQLLSCPSVHDCFPCGVMSGVQRLGSAVTNRMLRCTR
jgi:hypothetical protein